VSHSELSTLLFVTGAFLAIVGTGIHLAIIAAVNRRRNMDSQISNFERNSFRVLNLHRQLYPKSQLRKAFIFSMAFGMLCVFGCWFLNSPS